MSNSKADRLKALDAKTTKTWYYHPVVRKVRMWYRYNPISKLVFKLKVKYYLWKKGYYGK